MKRQPNKTLNKPGKIVGKLIKGNALSSSSSVGKSKKWKKVKIAGNLVTDDGGGGLEGLIGLEVMEDYGKNIITKDKKTTKRQRQHNSDEDNSDEQHTDTKRKPKKTKKKPKLSTVVAENSNSKGEAPVAGQFVLLPKPIISASNCSDDMQEELMDWKSKGVPDLILKALAEKGFNTPTEIQSLTLSAAILGRKDILGAAETGSGKTLAFGIPILNGILQLKDGPSALLQYRKSKTLNGKNAEPSDTLPKVTKPKKRQERDNCTPPPEECNNFPVSTNASDHKPANNTADDHKPLYALILTPTRELAVQVKDHIKAAAKYTGIQVAAIFGGLAQVKQERVLRKCPEIVVATPGRLWELVSEGNPHLNKLEYINFLVIDETDRMVEKGHFDELKLLLSRLNADPTKKSQRQNFVFSATLSMVHDLPAHLQKKNGRKKFIKQTSTQKLQHLIDMIGMAQPKIVDITQKAGTASLLTECRITCQLDQKDLYLYYFLQRHPGRTIVFCNSVDCVRRLAQLFGLLDCQPRPLHAHMNQRQRLKNLERFTASDTALLVATDVAARGLDIPNVQHVIHYQVPRTSENYVHRSGRTARAKSEGLTLLLMEPSEVKDYVRLCRTLGRTEDLPLFPVSERHLKAVRARVDLARQVDVLELKVRRKQSDIGWLKKSAKEMDIIVDDMSDFSESELYDSDDGGDRHKIKRHLKQKRDALTALLSKSLFPKGFSYKYPTSSGELDVPSMMDKENAVELMKTTIESNRMKKNKK